MSMMVQPEQAQIASAIQESDFTFADDGLPIFLGETYEEHSDAWDEVDRSVWDGQWKLAAIAASLETKRGEKTVRDFAYAKKIGASTVRGYARAYRVFGKSGRIPFVPFSLHVLAATAKNPVRALKVANDREMGYRDLKRWIYMGEGRGSREVTKALPPRPSARDSHEVIDVGTTAIDIDDEPISIEDEELSDEERAAIRSDIELGLRLVAAARSRIQSSVILRYFASLEEELDYELEAVTKLPGDITDRVESIIRGGCWLSDQIMKRARIKTPSELDRVCQGLEKAGKIKWSREGKRKHGTAPEMWMPSDMPDGGEFNLPRNGMQPESEWSGEEHY